MGPPEYGMYNTNPEAFFQAGFVPVWNEGWVIIWRPPHYY